MVWVTLKHDPPHVLPRQVCRSTLKGVSINRGEPQNLGVLKQACPDMCYHVKFGHSASKGVCINRR